MTDKHHENNGTDERRSEELELLATTRALDRLTAEEEAVLSSAIAKGPDKRLLAATQLASHLAPALVEALASRELPSPSAELRLALAAELDQSAVFPAKPPVESSGRLGVAAVRRRRLLTAAVAISIVGIGISLLIPTLSARRESGQKADVAMDDPARRLVSQREPAATKSAPVSQASERLKAGADGTPDSDSPTQPKQSQPKQSQPKQSQSAPFAGRRESESMSTAETSPVPGRSMPAPDDNPADDGGSGLIGPVQIETVYDSIIIRGNKRDVERAKKIVAEMPSGKMPDGGGAMPGVGGMMSGGMNSGGMNSGGMMAGGMMPSDKKREMAGMMGMMPGMGMPGVAELSKRLPEPYYFSDDVQDFRQNELFGSPNREAYSAIRENAFRMVRDEPLSTFSIDVDTASYANVRRILTAGQLPPPDAVRIEELLNYFSYSYPQPPGNDPFSVNMEVAECPWRPENRLLRVGLKGRDVPRQERPASNLVFLVDVSGSMQPENKLPLIKTALKLLVRELTENDRVAIVTYAGDAGLKLPPTNGTDQRRILNVIDSLSAGGSTHGSAGIELAYEQATGSFIRGGTNRVILLTDGDLNVGITDDDSLVQLIERKAKTGVFLTVLGVGDGNLKDSKMEKLADHGNGVYGYLDGVREARKLFVEQMSGSLMTIAKDVKLQIEFNPAQVQAYRLIGYENRVLANRDFQDDAKDAGEIGAGHTVTALYELVPATAALPGQGEPLKYQPQRVTTPAALPADQVSRELLTLKLRFKRPETNDSELRDFSVENQGGKFGQASTDFRFASSVAMFGLVLRHSPYRGSASLAAAEEIATSSLGEDQRGYRAEFVDLVRKAEQLK